MKTYILSLVFLITLGSLNTLTAQSSKEITNNPKTDDTVLIAYPNPTKDLLVIKLKDPKLKIKTVNFYSILGNQVLSFSVNMNSAELHLEKLRPGKYVMKYILSDNSQKVKQIVKL